MNSVIVAMFETEAKASQARSKLIAAGFAADAVTLTGNTGSSVGSTSSTSTPSASAEPQQGEGAISRFFHNLFGGDDADESRAGYTETYGEAFRRGAYGLSVDTTTDEEIDRAEDILNDAGAIDIDEHAETWRKEGWTGAAAAAPTTAYTAGATTGLETAGTQKLQEVEEELKVGKRAVARGGLRVFKRLIETPVEESVRLREEHATIERRTVDRPATEADFTAFKEGSIEVRETGEEAVVSKTARVTGEVEIGKTVTERDEVVRDTVRKTQVDVEEIAAGTKTASTTTSTTSTTGGVYGEASTDRLP